MTHMKIHNVRCIYNMYIHGHMTYMYIHGHMTYMYIYMVIWHTCIYMVIWQTCIYTWSYDIHVYTWSYLPTWSSDVDACTWSYDNILWAINTHVMSTSGMMQGELSYDQTATWWTVNLLRNHAINGNFSVHALAAAQFYCKLERFFREQEDSCLSQSRWLFPKMQKASFVHTYFPKNKCNCSTVVKMIFKKTASFSSSVLYLSVH